MSAQGVATVAGYVVAVAGFIAVGTGLLGVFDLNRIRRLPVGARDAGFARNERIMAWAEVSILVAFAALALMVAAKVLGLLW